MSYLQQKHSPRERLAAAASVIAIHAGIGLAIVTGMTVAVIVQDEEGWEPTVYFPAAQPPEEPTPPPPQPSAKDVIVVPTPPLPIPVDVPDVTFTDTIPDLGPTDFTFDPGKDEALNSSIYEKLPPIPKNGPAGWINTNDYPSQPLRRGIEGIAEYRLVIGTDGRPSACEIRASSGDSRLDAATCKYLERRARFDPAKDEFGNPIVGTYRGSVSWEIPD